MKKRLLKDLKLKGYGNAKVVYLRLDTHLIAYDVYLDEKYTAPIWDGQYFVGEDGSKESMILDWRGFLSELESYE